VLNVRALPRRATATDGERHAFDLRRLSAQVVVGSSSEHVRIDHAGMVIRLDIIEGTLLNGAVSLRFELAYDQHLPAQLSALREFDRLFAGVPESLGGNARLAEMLFALRAFDARAAGASLRSVADMLLGNGEWPGDGEHRKSRVRRLVETGESLVRAGPRAILARG
jgi:hypothetical protein